jgi:seryl-tRNA synthetase
MLLLGLALIGWLGVFYLLWFTSDSPYEQQLREALASRSKLADEVAKLRQASGEQEDIKRRTETAKKELTSLSERQSHAQSQLDKALNDLKAAQNVLADTTKMRDERGSALRNIETRVVAQHRDTREGRAPAARGRAKSANERPTDHCGSQLGAGPGRAALAGGA